MLVNPVGIHNTNTQKRKHIHPAVKGALVGAAVSTTSTGISWLKSPEEFKQAAKEMGGKNKYALSLVGSIALVSLFGAVFNTTMHKIIQNTVPSKQPKAVN